MNCCENHKKHATIQSNMNSSKTYTCPMHPEVEKDEPGSCPECGMDLVESKGEQNMHEQHDHGNHNHNDHS